MKMARSNEAFWWSLFSAGGVMAALFVPVLVIVTGLLLPFGEAEGFGAGYEEVHRVVSFWAVRLVTFVVFFLTFFHCAHRIRHILMDIGLRAASRSLFFACYGAAVVGTVLAALTLSAL